jgi:hypothetical protein
MESQAKEKQVIKPYDEAIIEKHSASCGGKRNLREIVITTDEEEFHYLVKKPSRAVMQAIADYEKKNDINGIQKLMLGCVLEGDREAYEHDGSIYIKILEGVGKMLYENKDELKKL